MKLLLNFSVEILLEKRYPTLSGFGLKNKVTEVMTLKNNVTEVMTLKNNVTEVMTLKLFIQKILNSVHESDRM